MDRYVGLDVHLRSTTIAVISATGKRVKTLVVETNGQALVEAMRLTPGQLHICLEEGTQSAWLVELLRPYAEEVVVSPAGQDSRAQERQAGCVEAGGGTADGRSSDQCLQSSSAPGRAPVRSARRPDDGAGSGAGPKSIEGCVPLSRDRDGRECLQPGSAREVDRPTAKSAAGTRRAAGKGARHSRAAAGSGTEVAVCRSQDPPDRPDPVHGSGPGTHAHRATGCGGGHPAPVPHAGASSGVTAAWES